MSSENARQNVTNLDGRGYCESQGNVGHSEGRERLALMPRIVDARLPAAPLWFRGDRGACVKLQPAAMVMRLDVQRSSGLSGIGVGVSPDPGMGKSNQHKLSGQIYFTYKIKYLNLFIVSIMANN
jgi:hypothetical protein